IPIMANISGCDCEANGTDCDSEFKYSLFKIVYSIIFVIGVPSNIIAVWFLLRVQYQHNKGLNEVKVYMINLCVADIVFTLTLPFWIVYYARNGEWIFKSFSCSLLGSLFYVSNYSSLAFLALISYNRYQAVTSPIKTAQFKQKTRGIIISSIIWGVLVIFLLSTIIQKSEHMNTINGCVKCFEGYGDQGTTLVLVYHFFMIAGFFLTFMVVIVCSIKILRTLAAEGQQQVTSHHGAKKQAFRMATVVLAVFILCFFPHHLVQGPWVLLKMNILKRPNKILSDIHQVTLCMMSFNCVLDPIIYCFITTHFRATFRNF
uniref:Platelet-activating factor receptor n=1 Tax=Latimeria chalumnae TaxID=7897 RepID=H3B8S6_LATCH